MDSNHNGNVGRLLIGAALVLLGLSAQARPQTASLTFVMQAFPPFVTDGSNGPEGVFPETLRAVAVLNIDVGNYLIRHDNMLGIKAIGEIKKIEYVIGLSRKAWSTAQAEQFNSVLLDLTKSGTLSAIAEKYRLNPAPSTTIVPAASLSS